MPSKPYDDEFILNFAYQHNALIVSNDGYKEFREKNKEISDYAEQK